MLTNSRFVFFCMSKAKHSCYPPHLDHLSLNIQSLVDIGNRQTGQRLSTITCLTVFASRIFRFGTYGA